MNSPINRHCGTIVQNGEFVALEFFTYVSAFQADSESGKVTQVSKRRRTIGFASHYGLEVFLIPSMRWVNSQKGI